MILGYVSGLPPQLMTAFAASAFLCLLVLSWEISEDIFFLAAWQIAVGAAVIAISPPDQYQFELLAVLLGLCPLLSGLSALVRQVLVVIELKEIEHDTPKESTINS